MTRPRADLWALIEAALMRRAAQILGQLADDEHGRTVRNHITMDVDDIERRPLERLRFRWTWDDAARERTRAHSLVVAVDVVAPDRSHAVPLLTVRARDLCLADGRPVDTVETLRELCASMGLDRVPDTPADLIDAQRPAQRPESGPEATPDDIERDAKHHRAYLGCAIAALLRPGSEPLACCAGRGDRELSDAHEQAHVLAEAWRYRDVEDRRAYRALLVERLRALKDAG